MQKVFKLASGMVIELLMMYPTILGEYLILMGRTFRQPGRMCTLLKRYVKGMCQSGVDSIPLALSISLFVGAVICIQMRVNVQGPWMSRQTTSYVTRKVFLSELTGVSMCLILAGRMGSNIASELGTMRVTQQVGAFDIMGMNPVSYLIPPKIAELITIIPFLMIFSSVVDIVGAYGIAYSGVLSPDDLTAGFQYSFNVWFVRMSIIKSITFAFVITSVFSFYGYSARDSLAEVGEASTNAVASSSVLVLFADVSLTPLLS